jgi:hypothetical protein
MADNEQPGFDSKSKPVVLPDLRNHQCRWPVTPDNTEVGGFLFCTQPTDGASPYCARHHRLSNPSGHYGSTAWKRFPNPTSG